MNPSSFLRHLAVKLRVCSHTGMMPLRGRWLILFRVVALRTAAQNQSAMRHDLQRCGLFPAERSSERENCPPRRTHSCLKELTQREVHLVMPAVAVAPSDEQRPDKCFHYKARSSVSGKP